MTPGPPTYRPQASSLAQIQQAAEAWLRAEFAFRCGAHGFPAYGPETAEWYTDANDALREALTGETDLIQAGAVLGLAPVKNPRRKGPQ
jgi:hypothetical protein